MVEKSRKEKECEKLEYDKEKMVETRECKHNILFEDISSPCCSQVGNQMSCNCVSHDRIHHCHYSRREWM